jgi:Na+/H+ antiporter NhaC
MRSAAPCARTERLDKSRFFTWVLGVIVFIDDYLNALAVAAAMRKITDGLRVPREHLAYTVNSTGACVCVIVPFTSWAAFAISCMSEYGLSFGDYVSAIPFMFYPWAAVIISLLTAIGVFPRIGALKKAYQRVDEGGETTLPPDKSGAKPIVSMESASDVKPVNPLNFLIPIIGLVVIMILFDNDMIHGLIAALVIQGILYLVQRIMTLTQYMNAILDGVTSMANLIFTILIAFTLAGINEHLGFSEYMIGLFTTFLSPALLPALTFLICAFIAFTSCSFWALIVIGTPVFVPLALGLGIPPGILVAGIMSGTALGSQCCFYSDAVFMTAAGTGVSNVPQVRTAAPYVLIGVGIATIAFLIVGFMV